MNITELRNHLDLLSVQCEEAVHRRDVVAYRAIQTEMLAGQRNLQELIGGEFAMPLSGSDWAPTHPTPLIFSDGYIVWVICPMVSAERPLLCRVVQFGHVLAHRASEVSDSLEEQPLVVRGLESCKAFEIRNSSWIEQLKATVHDVTDIRHFALCFKECLIEVIAKSIEWAPDQRRIEACITDFTKNSQVVMSING